MTVTPLMALHAQARAGAPDAVALTAVVAALGFGEPANWLEALTRLRRAAALGSAFADAQLALLAETGLEVPPQAISPQPLRADPPIASFPGFLPKAVCDWLIGRAAGRVVKAQTYDMASGERRSDDMRSNSAFGFLTKDLDLVIVAVRARIAAAVGVAPDRLELSQILHYAPGETFDRHHDFFDPEAPGFAPELARSGQRIATFLIYLNRDFEGGETEFPILQVAYKGQPGDALMFANVDRQGAPDHRTLHAGLPPRAGEKWLFSQWIRERRAI
jgi:prolyl 4-hydroxylase